MSWMYNIDIETMIITALFRISSLHTETVFLWPWLLKINWLENFKKWWVIYFLCDACGIPFARSWRVVKAPTVRMARDTDEMWGISVLYCKEKLWSRLDNCEVI